MSTADQLLEQMFSWMEERECCAKQLRKLAQELESLRKKCNGSECVASSVGVVGAACLIGAGVATFFTAGAAAPFLGVLGAAYTGVGVTVSVATKITEHFISSDTMEEVQKIEKKSNKIAEKIQKLFERLKAERREVSSDPEDLDQHVMTEILSAMARRSGLRGHININMFDDEPQCFFHPGQRNMTFDPMLFSIEMTGLVCILAFFTCQLSGKNSKPLLAKGAKELIKLMSTTGFKTTVKAGAMVVGGAVGLAFELPEAIDNWKEMINNNHVTEASKSLRDTADDILKISRTLRKQFNNIKKMFDEMAKSQREQEEKFSREKKSQQDSKEKEKRGGRAEKTGREQERESDQQGGGDQGDKKRDSEDEDRDQEDEESDSEEESDEDECIKTGRKKTKRHQKKKNKHFETNPRPPAAIRMGLLNVKSINKKHKRQNISNLITQNNLDVFLTTETWLQEDTADRVLRDASPEDFNYFYQTRDGRRGGGVAVQFSQELQGDQIYFNFITTFEYVATVLRRDEWEQPVIIINVYLPPGYNRDQLLTFLEEFEMLLMDLHEYSIIITGDFNINANPKEWSFRHFFFYHLELHDLVQHVEDPTHNRGNTLDLVITRNVEISNLSVQDDRISDHSTIYFNAKPVSKDTRKKTKEKKEQDEQAKRFRKKKE